MSSTDLGGDRSQGRSKLLSSQQRLTRACAAMLFCVNKEFKEGAVLQWAFALPVTLLRLPYSLVESALWSGMLYWIIGFDPDAGR